MNIIMKSAVSAAILVLSACPAFAGTVTESGMCFLSQESLDKYIDSMVKKDPYGMEEAAQNSVHVNAGTKAIMLNFNWGTTEVRLTSGDNAGADCFIPTEWYKQ